MSKEANWAVQHTGLPNLNGKEVGRKALQGIVPELMEAKGRYQVRLVDALLLAFKPSNLTCEQALALL